MKELDEIIKQLQSIKTKDIDTLSKEEAIEARASLQNLMSKTEEMKSQVEKKGGR